MENSSITPQQQTDQVAEQKRGRGRPRTGQKQYTSICLYVPVALTEIFGSKAAACNAVRKQLLATVNDIIAKNGAANG